MVGSVPFPRIKFDHDSSDYNYIRHGDQCIPVGPEPIPAGVCNGSPGQTYKGSSGYRKIPGDTCDRDKGLKLDEKKEKPCSQGESLCYHFNIFEDSGTLSISISSTC